ncbi:MAG TPA: site-2 protease family protein [Candidatus Acidoferrum sp.]|nr:site-2 protease family protein [Candidatus Acidoferrum sp.]
MTLDKIILIAIFLLVAFPVHEFAHAYVAYRLGDGTAKMFGRLTLNPVVHFDPIGGLMLVISALYSGFIVGWAKPTPVNPAMLRDRRNGEVWVALAGPGSNLVMAILGAIVFRALIAGNVAAPNLVYQVVFDFVYFNIAIGVFNLIPIPPLDGSTLLFRALDPQTAYRLRPVLNQYGFLILVVVILFGVLQPVGELIYRVANFLVGG